MTRQARHYSGSVLLDYIRPMQNAAFAAAFPGITGKRYDSFSRYAGSTKADPNLLLPVTRIIFYKTKNPSLHKCDGRCRSAKGGNCECACGGANHGAG